MTMKKNDVFADNLINLSCCCAEITKADQASPNKTAGPASLLQLHKRFPANRKTLLPDFMTRHGQLIF